MSTRGIVNPVDDEEMSSQEIVNALVARLPRMAVQAPTYQSLLGLPPFPTAFMPTVTQQSTGVGLSRPSPMMPILSMEVIAMATIPINTPSRKETKKMSDKVLSMFQAVLS